MVDATHLIIRYAHGLLVKLSPLNDKQSNGTCDSIIVGLSCISAH